MKRHYNQYFCSSRSSCSSPSRHHRRSRGSSSRRGGGSGGGRRLRHPGRGTRNTVAVEVVISVLTTTSWLLL